LHDDAETDSAYGEDNASTTSSIASSIRKYRELHGRTYHNFNTESSSEYWGPNDEKMNEQLDIGHAPSVPRIKKMANELVDIT
jgi:hypothetical protein